MLKLAEKYSHEKPLIFYPFTYETRFFSEAMQKEYGFKAPVCVCDTDESKWNKIAYEDGIMVISLKEAMEKYSDFQIFIPTFNDKLKFKIEEYLISEINISESAILNYEPYIERYGCNAFVDTIFFSSNSLLTCCYPKFYSTLPTVELSSNYKKSIDEVLAIFKDRANIEREIHPCRDCTNFTHGKFSSSEDNAAIKRIHFSHIPEASCNFKCTYCSVNEVESGFDYKSLNYSDERVIECIRYLIENKLISNLTTSIGFAHGEIGVFKYREEYLNLISGFYNYFTTNCSVYIENIHNFLMSGSAVLNTSLDCGTAKTFYKIKKVDVFEKVYNNIIRYSENAPNTIELKYIFLPGLNDNERDIYNFIEIAKKIKVRKVLIDMDKNSNYLIDEEYAAKIKYMIELCISEKIPYEIGKGNISKENLRLLKIHGAHVDNISRFNLNN
jgi:pyruvate-formate lyase-activating enzyme